MGKHRQQLLRYGRRMWQAHLLRFDKQKEFKWAGYIDHRLLTEKSWPWMIWFWVIMKMGECCTMAIKLLYGYLLQILSDYVCVCVCDTVQPANEWEIVWQSEFKWKSARIRKLPSFDPIYMRPGIIYALLFSIRRAWPINNYCSMAVESNWPKTSRKPKIFSEIFLCLPSGLFCAWQAMESGPAELPSMWATLFWMPAIDANSLPLCVHIRIIAERELDAKRLLFALCSRFFLSLAGTTCNASKHFHGTRSTSTATLIVRDAQSTAIRIHLARQYIPPYVHDSKKYKNQNHKPAPP